ncbi:hypothetical protein [Methylomonas sp. AM2-LC]|uniref:hypothetical protein n=1 Tax=Methylomonas sp. AM2-LC TaxID=3153301 RepID=UPI003265D7C4
MQTLSLVEGLYLYPTPAGAFYATASQTADKARDFLLNLLKQQQTPALTLVNLQKLTGIAEPEKAMEQLLHCQKLGWVQGVDNPLTVPGGTIEDLLPDLLAKISEHNKVLLADEQGFYLVCSGFPHEVAEELSALSAELASVYARRSGLLMNNMGIFSQAWAIVDAWGHSQIGCWPLFIGNQRFVLVISGVPHFNHAEFVTLVWMLITRYLKTSN